MESPEAGERRIILSGALSIIAAAWAILSISVAESLTPGYNVSTETVSGLGSPIFSGVCSSVPSCVAPIQPASAVIVFSFFLNGALLLWASYLFRKATNHRVYALAIGILSVMVLLVGVSYLPFYLGGRSDAVVGAAYDLHITAAITAFFLGPVLAIAFYRITRGPFRFLTVVIGAFALAAGLLFLSGNYLGLGLGGMERMIIYPLDIWQALIGSYFLGGLKQIST
jgi:hypothetical membrane protein